jgi:copper chaperone CopZ
MTTSTIRTYRVPDVSCDHCVAAITAEVEPIDGVASIAVDLGTGTVTVQGGDDAAIRAAIDTAGYDIAG